VEEGHLRVRTNVAHAPKRTRALRLQIDRGVNRFVDEREAYGNHERLPGSTGGRERCDASRSQHVDRPRRSINAHQVRVAAGRGGGRIVSRGSDGSRNIERVMPALRYVSRTASSGAAPKTFTEIV